MTSQATFTQKCPTCGRRLQIRASYLGKKLTCQHCQGQFIAQDSTSVLDDDSMEENSVLAAINRVEDNLQKSGIHSRMAMLQK